MKYEVYILPFSIVVVVYFWTSSFVVRTSKIHIVLVRRDKWIEKKVSCPGLRQQQDQKQCINYHQLTLKQLGTLITVTSFSQKRSPLTTSIAGSQTTFYSASPANDFCGTDFPRCLWHSPPTDKVHFRKKFLHIIGMSLFPAKWAWIQKCWRCHKQARAEFRENW